MSSASLPEHEKSANILRCWTALEVLTPQSYRMPEKHLIASLEKKTLPWEGGGEPIRPDQRLYYEIILGTIDLEKALASLLDVYADKRIERPGIKGTGLLASVIVNSSGVIVGANSAAISSFCWGAPKALKGDLEALSDWANIEQILVGSLKDKLDRVDDEGNAIPIDRDLLLKAYRYVVEVCDLPSEWISPPSFAVRMYEYYKNQDPPDASLLNSFFINDLKTAKNLFLEGKETKNLRSYLGLDKPTNRLDLLQKSSNLETIVAPNMIPAARWPGPGRHSLVLLQQAAVNLAVSSLENTGILAVNGPPGTGKTTLLRDVIASVITQRAEAMCTFDDPVDAFEATTQKLQVGQAWLNFYKLSEKLKGYEIVIASSNNKAVENVSAELPGINAIAEDAKDLRYFTPLATELLKKDSWGLIAAVLGNAKNRHEFRQKFWWDADFGLSTYLAEATGIPQIIEIKDKETKKIVGERRPIIVETCDPPENREQACSRWQEVRREFQERLLKSKTALEELENINKLVAGLSALEAEKQLAQTELESAQKQEYDRQAAADEAHKIYIKSGVDLDVLLELRCKHADLGPNIFAKLFKFSSYKNWKDKDQELCREIEHQKLQNEVHHSVSIKAQVQLREAVLSSQKKGEICDTAKKAYDEVCCLIDDAKNNLSKHLIDADFSKKNHDDKHQTIPWCSQKIQHLRDDVFISAIKLHKAFIDAAARPLRHNLGLLMQAFSGRIFSNQEQQDLLMDLWSSLFLIVPSISTTFASVDRMFGKIPPESLGWLLVDEAGQALPQAAVGAIMRTKRAVIVGDPMQIEPVVTLPEMLTKNICYHFKMDPDIYNAPEASAQTLADAATPYYAEFDGKYGSRRVGVPLLVHRRCANPMFSISNVTAYDRLMVHAKHSGESKIKDCLGDSAWIDVQGTGSDKWSPEEGQEVLKLLVRLKQKEILPNLYIVTPFVVVQDNMRRLILESGILNKWIIDPFSWVSERVGTVHTVQGREAEAVIFVLGAPASMQNGARAWAGGRPNLLNVAVTRAKEVLYVVGNRKLWKDAGLFKELADRL